MIPQNKRPLIGEKSQQGPLINPINNFSFYNQSDSSYEVARDIHSEKKAENDKLECLKQQEFTFKAPWLIASVNFSTRSDKPYRIAISSFNEREENYLSILQIIHNNLNVEEETLQHQITIEIKSPIVEIKWLPSLNSESNDLFATIQETLKIWEINENKSVSLVGEHHNPGYPKEPAPLSSFDWSQNKLDWILTGSIDTTCTIWNIQKKVMETQIIAHQSEVYDVAFSPDANIFASVGGDGTLKIFDFRSISIANLQYETQGKPLLRVEWNQRNPNLLAIVESDKTQIQLIDIRKPFQVFSNLISHKDCINSLAWCPSSDSYLLTGSDDNKAMIWNIANAKPEITEPILQYDGSLEICAVDWSAQDPLWVAMTMGKELRLLKI